MDEVFRRASHRTMRQLEIRLPSSTLETFTPSFSSEAEATPSLNVSPTSCIEGDIVDIVNLFYNGRDVEAHFERGRSTP